MTKNQYAVRAKVWLYPGMAHSTGSGQAGAWHFVTLPKKQSDKIQRRFGGMARGWGSLPVMVALGKTRWKTSIFPDTKEGAYLLPLKADVRKRENIVAGKTITLRVAVRIEDAY